MVDAFTPFLAAAFRLRTLRRLGFRLSDRDLGRRLIDPALDVEAARRLARRLDAEAAARSTRPLPVSQES